MSLDTQRVVPFPSQNGADWGGPQLSGPAMAVVFGITDRRLRQLCVEGMPRSSRGEYPLKACVQWYVSYWRKRSVNRMDELKREHIFLKNELLKLEIEKQKRRLGVG